MPIETDDDQDVYGKHVSHKSHVSHKTWNCYKVRTVGTAKTTNAGTFPMSPSKIVDFRARDRKRSSNDMFVISTRNRCYTTICHPHVGCDTVNKDKCHNLLSQSD